MPSFSPSTKSWMGFQIRVIPWPNTNEILTCYSRLVCKHILKGCGGEGEGISFPSQLLLAGSGSCAPWAPALLWEVAAPGLWGRGEGSSSGVWCLNSPQAADTALLLGGLNYTASLSSCLPPGCPLALLGEPEGNQVEELSWDTK